MNEKVKKLEKLISNKFYLKQVQNGDVNIRGSIVYNDIFSQLEKLGDHISMISQAVAGKI